MYSIHYTQEVSEVLDREIVVNHICEFDGFDVQVDLATIMREYNATILDIASKVGRHVWTSVRTKGAGYTTRTKL